MLGAHLPPRGAPSCRREGPSGPRRYSGKRRRPSATSVRATRSGGDSRRTAANGVLRIPDDAAGPRFRAARPYRLLRAPLPSVPDGAAAGPEAPGWRSRAAASPAEGAPRAGAARPWAVEAPPSPRPALLLTCRGQEVPVLSRPVPQRLRAPPCQRRAPACRQRPATPPPCSTPRGATAPPANERRRGTDGRREMTNRMPGGAGAGPVAAGPSGKCSAGRARPARSNARCRRPIPWIGVRSPNPARAPPRKALAVRLRGGGRSPWPGPPLSNTAPGRQRGRRARAEHRSKEFPPAGIRESNQRG